MGFHGGAYDQFFARGDAAFQATRAVCFAVIAVVITKNSVVNVATRTLRVFPTVADFHTFDSLDAHSRLAQTPVQLAVPLRMAAEADGHATKTRLDDAAQRVTVLFSLVDAFNNGSFGLAVETANRTLVEHF